MLFVLLIVNFVFALCTVIGSARIFSHGVGVF